MAMELNPEIRFAQIYAYQQDRAAIQKNYDETDKKLAAIKADLNEIQASADDEVYKQELEVYDEEMKVHLRQGALLEHMDKTLKEMGDARPEFYSEIALNTAAEQSVDR